MVWIIMSILFQIIIIYPPIQMEFRLKALVIFILMLLGTIGIILDLDAAPSHR